MSSLAIIVPSRGRPKNIAELLEAFHNTQTKATLVVVCDHDDPRLAEYNELLRHPLWLPGYQLKVYERITKGMARPLNTAAAFLKSEFDHFGFLGDDHRPRTTGWDTAITDLIDNVGTAVVYGNDLIQGEKLPTAVVMSGDIVRALDGMVPPNMIHLYLDDFWKRLGADLKSLHYLPDIVIEHLHPIAGKADWDDLYREVNDQTVYSADAEALNTFIKSTDYQTLLQKLAR